MCDVCTRVFHIQTADNPDPGILAIGKGPGEAIEHQPNLFSVLQSAKSGCHICSCFLRENPFLSTLKPESEPTDGVFTNIAGYNWTESKWIFSVKLRSRKGTYDSTTDFEVCRVKGLSQPTLSQVGQIYLHCVGKSPGYFEGAIGAEIHLQRQFPTWALPRLTLDLASRWIRDCRVNHTSCIETKQGVGKMPTRLLDVAHGNGKDEWKLCHTKDFVEAVEYFTLSHCWGQAQLLTLTSANLNEFHAGMSDEVLPQKYMDAFKVTRRLHFRYIWVDSLCIIQDSKQDWFTESMTMDAVYQNSFCTLAAGVTPTFENLNVGFLKPRAPDLEGIVHIKWTGENIFNRKPAQSFEGFEYSKHVLRHKNYYGMSLETSPLAKRSWCFQELGLSPRVLHFEAEQVFWEFGSLKSCEAFPFINNPGKIHLPFVGEEDIFISDIFRTAPDASKPYSEWPKILKIFTKGQLTVASDKLVAIAGVSKIFQQRCGGDYLAGLWRQDMPRSLIWHVHGAELLDQQPVRFTKLSKSYRAPSVSIVHLLTHQPFKFPRSLSSRATIGHTCASCSWHFSGFHVLFFHTAYMLKFLFS